jgi:thiol-disulfide isomerase/thioredoxin
MVKSRLLFARRHSLGSPQRLRCRQMLCEALEARQLLSTTDLIIDPVGVQPPTAGIGSPASLSFRITNAGPDFSDDVFFTFGDDKVAITTVQGELSEENSPFGTLRHVGGLVAGGSTTITLSGYYQDLGAASVTVQVASTAILDSTDTDPNLDNNTAMVSVSVVPPAVTSTADTVDPNDGVTTLREALQIARQSGMSIVQFAIPGAGRKTIHLTSPLPLIDQNLVIDGLTQPGATAANPLIEIEGSGAGTDANGFQVVGNINDPTSTTGTTIRGLIIDRFGGNGILIERFGHNVIESNFIGTDPSGANLGNGRNGVWAASDVNQIRGNTIAFNHGAGVYVGAQPIPSKPVGFPNGELTGYTTGKVAPQFMGTDQNGNPVSLNDLYGKVVIVDICATWCFPCRVLTQEVPQVLAQLRQEKQEFVYIALLLENDEPLHTPATQADAVAWAALAGSDPNVHVLYGQEGASIGSAWLNGIGSKAIPTYYFIDRQMHIASSQIGTLNDLHERVQPVLWSVQASPTPQPSIFAPERNAISANNIFANSGLGIDLRPDGVTPNDALDADTGANALQNSPMITSASATATDTIVGGSLASAASSTYHVEFFANNAADATGGVQGRQFLRAIDVTTNAAGSASFTIALGARLPTGSFVTATATDGLGNTSELSPGRVVTGNQPPSFDAVANRLIDEDAATQTITVTNVVGGPGDEIAQIVKLTATSSNPTLIPQPVVSVTGTSRTVTFRPAAGLSGTVTITLTADDGQGANSMFSRTFTVTVTAVDDSDVAISMTASPDPAGRLRTLTYTIDVVNNGPEFARNVQLTDVLPAGTTFAAIKLSQGVAKTPAAGGTGQVLVDLNGLAVGATARVILVVNVLKAALDKLVNTAQVSNSPQDPKPGNNSFTLATAVVDVGVFALTNPAATVPSKQPFVLGLKWTVPGGSWRELKTLDIRLVDDDGIAIWLRFDQATDSISLFNPSSGKFGPAKPIAVNGTLSHAGASIDLGATTRTTLGPTDPTIMLNLSLTLGKQFAGRRFTVQLAATDDLGNEQGFANAGRITVLGKKKDRDDNDDDGDGDD